MIQTERQQLLDEIKRLNAVVARLNDFNDKLLAWIKRWAEVSIRK
jgi:hypothetical protein